MRIGTNHGSLSDRIMSRYGDTPLGMVESALEFLRICNELNYSDIVLSMKASNTQVMVQAYRMLVNRMELEGMNYPLHLGVTEAGGGEDGRIKSAVGIGALLEDGLGDTIRVSLTEDPEFEVPVAISLADRYKNRKEHKPIIYKTENPLRPFEYNRRKSIQLIGIGGNNVPKVISDFSKCDILDYRTLESIGYKYEESTDKWFMSDAAADFIYLGKKEFGFELPPNLKRIYDYEYWIDKENNLSSYPLISFNDYRLKKNETVLFNFVSLTLDELNDEVSEFLKDEQNIIIVLETANQHGLAEQRRVFIESMNKGINNPVIIKRKYAGISNEEFTLYSATDFGGLLIDGFGDGVWVEADSITNLSERDINRVIFGILQAARVRISKTEYIACPSCGRTLFDLQETTEKIRVRTEHLKGVKIAIMGCIVNGPGEMADADYGYVGSGVGKITLYRGKDVVKRNINSSESVEELIGLIKEDGNWIEPK